MLPRTVANAARRPAQAWSSAARFLSTIPTPPSPPSSPAPNLSLLTAYLTRTFPSLPAPLPEPIALRAVTHQSFAGARGDHNARLAFLGRRTLRLYLSLFLHKHAKGALKEEVLDYALRTYLLGQDVGRAWKLEEVMRWCAAVPSSLSEATSDHDLGVRSGLFKVRGATVEAVLGAIHHAHGGAVSHTVFERHVLPFLRFTDDVPEGVVNAARGRRRAEKGEGRRAEA